MLYLKNSLVNLTIVIFILFFLTILSANNNDFIFPKKKIITIKVDEKKQIKVKIGKNFNSIHLPQKNPFRKVTILEKSVKKLDLPEKQEVKKKIISTDLTVVKEPVLKGEINL